MGHFQLLSCYMLHKSTIWLERLMDRLWHLFAKFEGRVLIRVRVRERLSATPGHVIGQGPAPGGRVVPRGGGGGGESDFPSRKLTVWSKVDFPSIMLTFSTIFRK